MTINEVLSLIEAIQRSEETMASRYFLNGNRTAEASHAGAVAGLARLKNEIRNRLTYESK